MRASVVSLAVMVAVWHIVSLLARLPFLPPPIAVCMEMIARLRSGELTPHLLVSLWRVIGALTAAFVPAFFLGIIAGRVKHADRLITPGIYLLYPIPKVALLPVILLFLGLGNLSKVFFVGMIVFFPFFLHIRDELVGLDNHYFVALRSVGGNRWDVVKHLLLPALLPRILSSLRMNVGTAIAVLFLAETFATRMGIGWYIMDAWSRLAYREMYAGIMALSIAGLLLFFLIDGAERRFCSWQSSE